MRASIVIALLGWLSGCGGAPNGSDGGDASVATPTDGGQEDAAASEDQATAPSDMSNPIDPTGLTTLRVHYPLSGHSLSVRGGSLPLDWTTGKAMSSVSAGVFQYQVTLPASLAQLEWKPLVDDSTWSRGPNYVVQRGATMDVYPHFYTQIGTVKKLFTSFHSTVLGNDRVVWAYLPPSYDENTAATFPVLYMHDGQNLFNGGAFGDNGWRVEHTLDGAAEDGSIRELIVIGPESGTGDQRWNEYTPTVDASEMKGGKGELYLKMVAEELKPQIDAMLRTQPQRATTGVMGSSLGGLISAYAGTKKATVFGLVGAMSPSAWWDNEMIVGVVQGMTNPRPDKVYVDTGDTDDGEEYTVDLVGAYQGNGYTEGSNFHYVVQVGGQHMETYWAQRLPAALAFLFGKRP